MLTMAMLAIIGAFIFGFVLCGMFAVGAAADRSIARSGMTSATPLNGGQGYRNLPRRAVPDDQRREEAGEGIEG